MIVQIIFQLAEWIGVSSLFVEEAARLDMLAFAYPAVRSRHEVPMKPAVNACVTVGAKLMMDSDAQNFLGALAVG